MSSPGSGLVWPSSSQFSEAIQNPRTVFNNPELRECQAAIDRFGMPLVTSGNFAYAFKLRDASNRATGVRCFRGFIPDRDKRYELIDRHLDAHPNTALADFDFEPEGILVSGRRYPIVLMEWIEGPNLDSYIEQVLGNKAALEHMADEWLKVMDGLRTSQVAHGDLQHGNIIVQNGRFRLIDFDGMWVPSMRGWRSNEIGHIHYQHPKRNPTDFDERLDNFSGIVIYLSLLALAEEPGLWRTYHDENLIFTKRDYLDPANSKLFAQVRKLGQQQKTLCDALANAARGALKDTPCVSDLASRKSKLPGWMTAPADINVQVRSREVTFQTEPAVQGQNGSGVGTLPWWKQVNGPTGQVAISSKGVTPSVQAAPAAWQARSANLNWDQIHRVAWPSALKIGLGGLLLFWIWVPLLQTVSMGIGITKEDSAGFVFWGYIIGCIATAYAYAYRKERSRPKIAAGAKQPVQPQVSPPVWQQPKTPVQWQSTAHQRGSAGTNSVVGSKIRFVYHRPTCEWALKMSYRNRVNFSSPQDAASRGYRACKVCRP